MAGIKQPQTSIKLTNVSTVRLKHKGKRFELACYKNKIVEWRQGIEKDLDNVLQVQQIFTNVSKGQLANSKDLKLFEMDQAGIIRMILEKGDIQVSDKERLHSNEQLLKDICQIIIDKTENPETGNKYTLGIIEKVVQDVHFSVNPSKQAKQQALECIHKIQESGFPIVRSRMRVQVSISDDSLREMLQVESDKNGLIGLLEPKNYKEFIQRATQLGATVQIISH